LDGKGWRYSGDLLPSFLDQNKTLFDLEFDSCESSRPVQLLGNALTMQFEGINLDTDRSYTRDGVMYSVAEDDLFNVNLDVDAAAGMVFGLPNGLVDRLRLECDKSQPHVGRSRPDPDGISPSRDECEDGCVNGLSADGEWSARCLHRLVKS